MENKHLVEEQRRQRDAKRFFLLWMRRLVVGYVLCMAAYFIWLFAIQGVTIDYVGGIQRNYAKFLVEQNDEFITEMIEFEALTAKTNAVYSESEKAAIKANLERQNAFLQKMQKRAPDESNSDYIDIYQDMLQIYAFYIQGEVMKAEYCYKYDTNFTLENQFSGDGASLESYTMGQELCNMMGNMILNNFKYINDIRDTNYKSKHNIVEMGNNEETPGVVEPDIEEVPDVEENEPENGETENDSTTEAPENNSNNTEVPHEPEDSGENESEPGENNGESE